MSKAHSSAGVMPLAWGRMRSPSTTRSQPYRRKRSETAWFQTKLCRACKYMERRLRGRRESAVRTFEAPWSRRPSSNIRSGLERRGIKRSAAAALRVSQNTRRASRSSSPSFG
eukprot:scaffold222403_cov31-Tisochrysis_lutea.AAC.3